MSDFRKGALVRDAVPFLKVAVSFLFHFFLSLELNAVGEETLITAERIMTVPQRGVEGRDVSNWNVDCIVI